MQDNTLVIDETIQNKIYNIRGLQVMLDRDLALLYGVENRRLNEQVKRNIERFPDDFMFQLTKDELENWKSQFATSNKEIMGLRKLPYVFTEQGVSMLSSILKSKTAITMSIKIIKTFVSMKNFLIQNASIFQRLDNLETNRIKEKLEIDEKFNKLFSALENKQLKPSNGIFFNGQIFDAYTFISDLIRSAKKDIILIDNYIDDSTLNLFTKVANIKVTIYTHTISKTLKADLEKYNKQYSNITIKIFKDSHDRFIILDNDELYNIGASLKDVGKKWFAFSKLDISSIKPMIEKLG